MHEAYLIRLGTLDHKSSQCASEARLLGSSALSVGTHPLWCACACRHHLVPHSSQLPFPGVVQQQQQEGLTQQQGQGQGQGLGQQISQAAVGDSGSELGSAVWPTGAAQGGDRGSPTDAVSSQHPEHTSPTSSASGKSQSLHTMWLEMHPDLAPPHTHVPPPAPAPDLPGPRAPSFNSAEQAGAGQAASRQLHPPDGHVPRQDAAGKGTGQSRSASRVRQKGRDVQVRHVS